VLQRFGTRTWPPARVPTRLVVPVLSATGGGCRSTVSALLAHTFAQLTPTAVVDAALPVVSPWPSWATPPPTPLAELGHGPISTPAGVGGVCSTQRDGGPAWQVLSPPAPPDGMPGPRPQDCVRLALLGGCAVTVVDTGHSALRDVSAGPDPAWSTTASWLEDTRASPILSVPGTSQGLDHAHRFVAAALRYGLRCDRVTVVVVGVGQGPAPSTVLASSTVLAGRVGATFNVPYDHQIQAHQMRQPHRLGRSTIRAVRTLAVSLVANAAVPPPAHSGPATSPANRLTAPRPEEWTPCDQR